MKDFFGRPIAVGNYLVFPGGQKGQLYMTLGHVVEIRGEDLKVQPISVSSYRALGMPIRLRRSDRAVIIDLPSKHI